jgi:hypothetical protein
VSFALPSLDTSPVRELPDIVRRFMAFASDVYEFLRLLPTVEFKTFTTVGDFPIYVETLTKKACGVVRVQSFETKDPSSESAYVSDTSISWRLSDDSKQPGIIVTGIGGAIGPDELTITLLVLGERV